MGSLIKKIKFLFLFSLLANLLFAQNIEIRGITVTGKKAIKKSVAEILAYDSVHPLPANFKAVLRLELHGPTPVGQDPQAKAISKSGTLVDAFKLDTTTSSTPPTQIIHSNFLSIWGSYSVINGRESPYTPPDNVGDVGTTQIIAAASTRMKVFNKIPVTGSA